MMVYVLAVSGMVRILVWHSVMYVRALAMPTSLPLVMVPERNVLQILEILHLGMCVAVCNMYALVAVCNMYALVAACIVYIIICIR